MFLYFIKPSSATYSLSRSVTSANEGTSFDITLTTTGVPDGTLVGYMITGVSSADIGNASLMGTFTISNNSASLSVNVTADLATEGPETFTLTLNDGLGAISVDLTDTSLAAAATTFDPLYATAGSSLSGDNRSGIVSHYSPLRSVAKKSSGKWYWEVNTVGDVSNYGIIGIVYDNVPAGLLYPGYSADTYGYWAYGRVLEGGVPYRPAVAYTSSAVIGIALDVDQNKLYFYTNGILQQTIDIAPGKSWQACVGSAGGGVNVGIQANFGQSAFAYPVPAGFSPGLLV